MGGLVVIVVVGSIALLAMFVCAVHGSAAAERPESERKQPVICSPTKPEDIASLMKRIDDRHIAWHVEQARKQWESERVALRGAAAEFIKAYDDYRGGDTVVFTPPAGVVEDLRAALEAPQ